MMRWHKQYRHDQCIFSIFVGKAEVPVLEERQGADALFAGGGQELQNRIAFIGVNNANIFLLIPLQRGKPFCVHSVSHNHKKGRSLPQVVHGLQLILLLEAIDAKLTLLVLAARIQNPILHTHLARTWECLDCKLLGLFSRL